MTHVYIASDLPTRYPRKLQKPATISDAARVPAKSFIMDSGIGDDISNAEVLDLAEQFAADFVVAKDLLHDFAGTTANVREFLELYESHPCNATPLIPVQCNPAADKWHVDHLEKLPEASHYVLGGMVTNEISTVDRIKSIKAFRQAVGPEPYVHGLGVGGGMEFVSKVAGTGWLDSVDCATPEMAATHGELLDPRLRRQNIMAFPGGDGRRDRTTPLAEFNSWQLQDVWNREANHGGLEAYS